MLPTTKPVSSCVWRELLPISNYNLIVGILLNKKYSGYFIVTQCPQGLRSDAIPEYVYFGTMMATMTVNEHEECLQKSAEKPRCKAVNYFHPFAYQENGFCELLSETQRDNPLLMRPFRKATYYERICCRDVEEDFVDIPSSKSSYLKN